MIGKNKPLLVALLAITVVLAGLSRYYSRQNPINRSAPPSTVQADNKQRATPADSVPTYVRTVLQYVEKNGTAPDGYEGGRAFQNREKRLPLKSPQGNPLRYREWDVKPRQKAQNRGPERLVTGNDRSAWYTKDHYRTFVKIK